MRVPDLPGYSRAAMGALAAAPVVAIFLSSNIVNAGNLLFNVLFSRWMGPEVFGQLAALLTIKLAILGVLGALQLAVSQRVAGVPRERGNPLDVTLWRLNRICFIALWLALPVLFTGLWWSDLHLSLGLGSLAPLAILFLSLPFAVPLSVLRGVAMGRLDARSVVISANAEMVVRLLGAIAAWQAGLGLVGVIAAIAASIAVGWVPLRRLLGRGARRVDGYPHLAADLVLAALPFALLQAGQVVLLDGDVVLAARLLDQTDTGYVAALGLFQRIQFFACFGLATVLLPAVATAQREGRSALGPASAVLALFAAVSCAVLAGAVAFPELMIVSLVGADFLPASDVLGYAAGSAVAFTLSYLVATYLSATGDRSGIWLIAAACPVQIAVMAHVGGTLTAMLVAKLGCQALLAGALVLRAALASLRAPAPQRIPV